MGGGFGSGFFTLTLLAVLAGLAVLLGAAAVAAVVSRRRVGRVPSPVLALAVALLAVVVLTSAFGVVVLIDEAPVGAVLLLVVVFAPLVAVGRRGDAGWRRQSATAGMAWSGPYLLATVAFIGVNAAVPRLLDLAPAEAQTIGVGWLAVIVAGVVATVGTVAIDRWLGTVLGHH